MTPGFDKEKVAPNVARGLNAVITLVIEERGNADDKYTNLLNSFTHCLLYFFKKLLIGTDLKKRP